MPPPRPRRVVEPGSRLFVGNLSYEIDTDQLRKFFEKWGPVSDCFLPQDRTTQKPRGFGFVTFRDAADAKLAVAQADGTELDGRQLRVNVAEDTRGPPQSTQPSTQRASKWGTKAEDDEDEERERRYEADEDAAKPDFGLSGALAKDENTGNVYKGHVLKWTEPDDARKPVDRWRIYEYKNGEQVKVLHIHRQSAFLIGRIKDIADILTMHPSCSGQHAVLQFRLKVLKDDLDEVRVVLPYVMDLESTNGTFLNGERLAPARYVELREKDMLKFGSSSREYVLIRAPA
jgi:smad nuclear-interacting protein 1